MFRAVDLITKKRDGQKLTREELAFLINGYVNNEIPDYQISAFLMAIYFVGLDFEEMTALTEVMVHSGDMIDLSPIKGVKVDKHSTGGVGDKTSLVVGPICAAGGVKIAKMSGRGLGHTGGTLDKLESIPGYKIELDSQAFFQQVNDIGLSIIGQSANITPADKKLYALRDVTGTIESIGLIAASIMSKKLASGADYIVLDVKVGSGAFMKEVASATKLAEAMVSIGKASGRKTVATLTDMEQPLGNAIGNTLEVIEAIETLKGKGPKDFAELCYNLSAEVFLISGIASSMKDALALVDEVINSGKALEKFKQMVERQGGNPKVVEDYSLMPLATHTVELFYREDQEAYVEHIDALKIGEAAMILGAGRAKKEDQIDHGVGIVIHKKVGEKVKKGEKIATLYTSGEYIEEALSLTHDAYRFSETKVAPRPIIITSIR
ncbi:MAG: pyrimidine-nucleoside phosphorylase [Bacilli bacterium]|nr:pyrimidine-nucleoside phosphorylase [Bacilli bacterium]HHU24438.1 pyrimidine-nucleoside phosphorylase [Acholeplasmataceae bacterium]